MIDSETLIKLRAMKLSGMAECLENIISLPSARSYTTPEIVKMSVDYEWDRRQNSKLKKLQKRASLAQPYADIADIRVVSKRTIDTELINRLAVGNYMMKRQDVVLQGPTGSGKTFVACALANKACQQFHSVLYLSASELFDRLSFFDRAGERKRALDHLLKVELLVIDDWFLSSPTKEQVQQLHVLIDRRHRAASTIFCTQLTATEWHDQMEEKVLADAIVDRIMTNAHITVLDCKDSLRRIFNSLAEN
jgi:DNA replication protein DnaC